MKKIGAALWNCIEGIALWCLRLLFRILHRKLTTEAEAAFLQFVKFGLVGVSNTAVNYVIYVACLALIESAGLWEEFDYLAATAAGFVLSVLWSFFWNHKFVFTVEEGGRRSVWKALVKTYISYSFTGLFLNSVLMLVWVKVFHISEYLGPIFNLLLSVPVNFLINKYWAFKKEE